MYCSKCGTKVLATDAKFCANCGFELARAIEPELEEPKSEVTIIESEIKAPLPVPQSESDPAVSSLAAESKPVSIPAKPERKWGWGWYILSGYVFTGTNRVYEGYGYGEFAGYFAMLGAIVSLPVYFLLRNRSILTTKISHQAGRSFLSGVIAAFIAGFVVAGVAHVVPPIVGKHLHKEFRSVGDAIKVNNVEIIAAATTFGQRYIQSPVAGEEAQRNVSFIEEFLLSLRTRFTIVVESLRKAEASTDKVCKLGPKFEKRYSPLRKMLQDSSVKLEQWQQAYEDWLTSLRNYNLAVVRADQNADAYLQTAQTAFAQVESKEQEVASLLKEFSEQK